MKKTLALVILAAVSHTALACPTLSGQSPQDFQIINDYTARLSRISDDKVYNKTVYSCFKENLEDISWDQTVELMKKLHAADYTSYDRSSVTEAMAEDYLKANFDVTFADVAVEIAHKMSSYEDANKMIEKYFKKALERKMVNYDQLVILMNGLKSTSYDYGRRSRSETMDRMAVRFIKEKVKEITIPQIIELATKARNTNNETNMTIEYYFDEHVSTLSWEETTKLMAALVSNSYSNRHAATEVSERMTLKWNKVHN